MQFTSIVCNNRRCRPSLGGGGVRVDLAAATYEGRLDTLDLFRAFRCRSLASALCGIGHKQRRSNRRGRDVGGRVCAPRQSPYLPIAICADAEREVAAGKPPMDRPLQVGNISLQQLRARRCPCGRRRADYAASHPFLLSGRLVDHADHRLRLQNGSFPSRPL